MMEELVEGRGRMVGWVGWMSKDRLNGRSSKRMSFVGAWVIERARLCAHQVHAEDFQVQPQVPRPRWQRR